MITANIAAYLQLEQLPELKQVTRGGTTAPRKHPRYDLTALAGYWNPLERLKNHKGQIYLTLIPSDKNEARKQGGTTPSHYLQITPAKSKAINFSGVRFDHSGQSLRLFASGEPSDRERLKGGVPNPMYDRWGDAFLFIFTENMERLEVLIIDGGRLLIDAYRRQLAAGGLDEALEALRMQAKPVIR
ncbi:hypothetical protein LJC45_02735 [Alistipes sp. OttesenSCG-928-B03]|nr:hypothetical protein [Alistipes sp. OttesenSCG-928-B03]